MLDTLDLRAVQTPNANATVALEAASNPHEARDRLVEVFRASRFGVWRWLTALGLLAAAACGPASTRPSGPEAYEIEWWVTRLTPEPREDADVVVQNEGDDVCELELGERSDDGVVQWRAITLAGGALSSGAELTIPTLAPGAYFLRATSCSRRRAVSEVHFVDASQVASAKLRISAASR